MLGNEGHELHQVSDDVFTQNPHFIGQYEYMYAGDECHDYEKILKFNSQKFLPIFSTNILNISIKLSFDIENEITEKLLCFRFLMHKKDPCGTRKIINYSYK